MGGKTNIDSAASIVESLLSFPGETEELLNKLESRGWDVSAFRNWEHTPSFLADCYAIINDTLK